MQTSYHDLEINQSQKVFHMIYTHKEPIIVANVDRILEFFEYMRSEDVTH